MVDTKLGEAGSALLAEWLSLPKRDFVPDRSAFDPFRIARFLPVLSVIEDRGVDNWRIRLAGTEIDRRNGQYLTGRDYRDFLHPDVLPMYNAIFRAVTTLPCGSHEIRRISLSSGRTSLVEVVRLPLRAADGRVRLIVSSNEEVGPPSLAETQMTSRLQRGEVDSTVAVISPRDHEFIDVGRGTPPPAQLP